MQAAESGLLEFLASSCAAAKELLRRYVFFVIPVLNPDGALSCDSACWALSSLGWVQGFVMPKSYEPEDGLH